MFFSNVSFAICFAIIRTGITEVDKAVLSLKAQRRRLEDHRKQVLNQIDREQAIARQLVVSGHRDRALLALKKRRIQETSLEKLDVWLINVESTVRCLEINTLNAVDDGC